jgi:hypothetical protein
MSTPPKRPAIREATKLLVWGRAAGRCTLCNSLVTENEDLGELVGIGEIAHNVGWGKGSPRGESELSPEDRASPDNLILLCRNCHKPVDAGGSMGRYSVEELMRRKRDHEQRVRMFTGIGADKGAVVVRVVGTVRGAQPELTYDTVQDALGKSGYYPRMLPNAFRADYEVDLRSLSEPYSADEFSLCAREIDALTGRIHEGIRLDAVSRLAVFGFARIPVLVYLGAQLDDKVSTLVFQRQRIDGENAWCWPDVSGPVDFDISLLTAGTEADRVALVINLSGTIGLDELPEEQRAASSIYSIAPASPVEPGPMVISSPAALARFENAVRSFLARVESSHGKIPRVDVFAAVPVSAAVCIGRTLMPNVSPALRVFDRGEDGRFFAAIEVKR